MRNGADPWNGYGDKMRNGTDLDKMRHFNEFFPLFSTFLCFRFFFNGIQRRIVFIDHNISYTAISINNVTETNRQ
jgi:hypothetical protein